MNALTREDKDLIQAKGYEEACEDLKTMTAAECVVKMDTVWPSCEFKGYTPFNFNSMLGYAMRIKEEKKK